MKNVIYYRNKKQADKSEYFFNELKRGNHEAYRELYEVYGEELLRYIQSYFYYDYSRAQDVLQEVFINAYMKIDALKDITKIRSWLYRISSRKCIDYKRKIQTNEKYLKQYFEENNHVKNSSVEDEAIGKVLFQQMNNEVLKLPKYLCEIFILRQYQELKYHEIAEITKTTVSKVKKSMKKAVALVLKALEQKNINKDILY